MRPFRAPREARKIYKGASVTCEAEVATQEATPDLFQASSQEETALGTVWKPWIEKTWVIKEKQHPEEEAKEKESVYVRLDSITETGDEHEARMDREQLASPRNGCNLTLARVNALVDEGVECVRGSLTLAASTQLQGSQSVVPSPNLSEFEGFLGAMEAIRKEIPKKRPSNMSNDEWWNSVLEAEKQRCKDDVNSRQVEIDDILLGDVSSDDDIPIVSTLPALTSRPKGKTKSKGSWTYETVVEATGVSSKYWDAAATRERATKKQAKEKLSAISVAEI
jgi:hypothetical protein